jgi:hypothetical protein
MRREAVVLILSYAICSIAGRILAMKGGVLDIFIAKSTLQGACLEFAVPDVKPDLLSAVMRICRPGRRGIRDA